MSDLLSIVRHLYAADIYYLTPRLLAGIFDLDTPQTYALVERLTRQELVTPVEKGKYMLVVLEPERVLGTPLFMGASAGQSGRRSARKPDSDKSGVTSPGQMRRGGPFWAVWRQIGSATCAMLLP